jgi:RNA polymerase sigma-70 factor (ECF subfamily)
MESSDSTIIEAIRRGDVDRYAELVDRHKDQVYGVLRRLVRDEDVAEDLAQTAFIQAYQSLDGFRREASFATWITQIAINLGRASFRRGRRATIVSLDELLERQSDAPTLVENRASFDPFENMVASDLEKRLEDAVAELPDDYREAFVLRHIENVSYEKIAALTGHSVGALKVRTHRARKMLLERLSDQENSSALRRRRS